jgi:hypothetical protein
MPDDSTIIQQAHAISKSAADVDPEFHVGLSVRYFETTPLFQPQRG